MKIIIVNFHIRSYADLLDLVRQHAMKKSFLFGLLHSTLKIIEYFTTVLGLGAAVFMFWQLSEERRPSLNDIVTVCHLNPLTTLIITGLILITLK